MSKRHSDIIQMYNSTEATKERTWTVAKHVWARTTFAEVARAFILAYRVMKKIIEEKGDNRWLADGTQSMVFAERKRGQSLPCEKKF